MKAESSDWFSIIFTAFGLILFKDINVISNALRCLKHTKLWLNHCFRIECSVNIYIWIVLRFKVEATISSFETILIRCHSRSTDLLIQLLSRLFVVQPIALRPIRILLLFLCREKECGSLWRVLVQVDQSMLLVVLVGHMAPAGQQTGAHTGAAIRCDTFCGLV